jgi:hypothetical protein
LIDAYDRGGLPFERVLTRLSYARWLAAQNEMEQSRAIVAGAREICRRFHMLGLERACEKFNEKNARP